MLISRIGIGSPSAEIPQQGQRGMADGPDGLLSQALQGLRMAYQPIMCARTKRVHGYEALLRTSEMSPIALLKLTERLQRLPEILTAVSYRTAAAWRENLDRGTLFINLHPQDLCTDLLQRGDSPFNGLEGRVVLELTELASIEEVPNYRERLRDLRDRGFRIAVDDLGSGHSSLSTVASLAPDIVKLDRSLVQDIDSNALQRGLVGAIASSLRDNGIQLVGEGIETCAERDVLVELGIDLLQGYWFARPGPEFPVERW